MKFNKLRNNGIKTTRQQETPKGKNNNQINENEIIARTKKTKKTNKNNTVFILY